MGWFLNIILIMIIAVAFGAIFDLIKKGWKKLIDKIKKTKE